MENAVTDAEVVEAVERARLHKPEPARLPAAYLHRVVESVVSERHQRAKVMLFGDGSRVSESDEKRLIFFLPLASVWDFSDSEKPATIPPHTRHSKPDTVAATHAATFGTRAEPNNDAGLTGVEGMKPDTQADMQPDTYPTQAKTEKPTHIHISNNYLYNPPSSPPPLGGAALSETKTTKGRGKVATGTRLPEGWTLPVAWADWAVQLRGWSREEVQWVAEGFREYWLAVAGRQGLKANWEFTWRKWVRNEHEVGYAKGWGHGAGRFDNSAVGKVERAIAERDAREAREARAAGGGLFDDDGFSGRVFDAGGSEFD